MENYLVIFIIILLALTRVPLFIILSLLTIYLFHLNDESISFIIVSFTELTKQYILIAIPLFTFAGYLMSESQTPQRLIRFVDAVLGFLPGGLAIVSLATCAVFTAFTGASGVTIVALGGLLYPMLVKLKYPEKFSLGVMTTSGSLGLLFAPSVPIILYGIVSKTDISKLFLAALIPGIFLILVLSIYSIFIGNKHNVQNSENNFNSFTNIKSIIVSKRILFLPILLIIIVISKMYQIPSFLQFILSSLSYYFVFRYLIMIFYKDYVLKYLDEASYELILPILIIVGIYTGQFTATESAAITAFYVLIIETLIYRDIDIFKKLPKIISESMIMVSAILIIMASALAFTNYLVTEQVPDSLLAYIQEYIDSKLLFLIALNIVLILVGCLMDIFSAILVVVPLITPIAMEYGIDPLHLGVIFLTNLEIGYLTPPVGLNLFLSSYRFDKNIIEIYKATFPFIILLLFCLIIITYVPELTLFWFN